MGSMSPIRSATLTSGVASFSPYLSLRCIQCIGVSSPFSAMRFFAYWGMGCNGSSLISLPGMVGIYSSSNEVICRAILVLAWPRNPRSNRGIFVINELPDLQARIQVALFNILEEGDVQIRGFKLRLPLDILFVFTANPEDYTNRGSIVTPLKDRIQSQILTHYPKTLEQALEITEQEAAISEEQKSNIDISDLVRRLIEQVAFEARSSELVDKKSGVSARLTISALENALKSGFVYDLSVVLQ